MTRTYGTLPQWHKCRHVLVAVQLEKETVVRITHTVQFIKEQFVLQNGQINCHKPWFQGQAKRIPFLKESIILTSVTP